MKNNPARLGLAATLILFATGASAAVVHSEDFETGVVGAEWSTNSGTLAVDTAPNGQMILGRNDGLAEGLSNQTVTLQLAGLAAHTTVSLSFDLVVIDSMDLNEPFSVSVDGATVLGPITFQNRIAPGQTFSSAPALTGVPISLDTHGFAPVNSLSRSDAVYRIDLLNVPHTAASLAINFSYTGLQAITDESWSIDNLLVQADTATNGGGGNNGNVPEPLTLALLGIGAAALRRRVLRTTA